MHLELLRKCTVTPSPRSTALSSSLSPRSPPGRLAVALVLATPLSATAFLQQLGNPACNLRCLASLRGAAVVLANHGLTVPACGELLADPHVKPKVIPHSMNQQTSHADSSEQLPGLSMKLS